jgi:hypothetical protein
MQLDHTEYRAAGPPLDTRGYGYTDAASLSAAQADCSHLACHHVQTLTTVLYNTGLFIEINIRQAVCRRLSSVAESSDQ